jgi:hypothetical protein
MQYPQKVRFAAIALLLAPGLVLIAASLSDLTFVRVTNLQADTHHVQGIDFNDTVVWVTSVEKAHRKGYLQEFSLSTGELRRTVDLTDGQRFHPGGLSAARGSLWIAVAEYRRASTSVIQKRNAGTLELEGEFAVADHIGCVAASTKVLVGANWDSRDFYVWDWSGRLLRKLPNPTQNAYQDMKFADGRLVASGLLPDRSGAIDWLEYPSLRLLRRMTAGPTSRGLQYTSEGMAVRGSRLLLLPEDSPSRLFEFQLPLP